MEQFARRDWLRGRACVVEHANREKTRGVAAGVEPDGALLLRPELGEPIAVTSGRVFSEELPTPDY
jgi:biotin-(acetyl-CoA carboxylase) ligase